MGGQRWNGFEIGFNATNWIGLVLIRKGLFAECPCEFGFKPPSFLVH